MEWLNSPTVYLENTSLAHQLRQLALESFHPYTCMRHYFHMAENNFRSYLQGNTVKMKKYLYVLRPLMACAWIMHYNSLPPVAFATLTDAVVSQHDILNAVRTLVKQKTQGEELGEGEKNHLLHQFIEVQIQISASSIKNLQAGKQPDTHILDQIFVQQLHEAWPAWK
jgi:predicted nucleotidyltransferase